METARISKASAAEGVTIIGDPRFDLGLYSPHEAARLARLPQKTLSNWLRGYEYPTAGGRARAKPVIRLTSSDRGSLSFINLIEAVMLAGFRTSGVSMQRVRKAFDYVARHIDSAHPLVDERILTDGMDLFWRFEQSAGDGIELVNVTQGGQKAFPDAVMRYLREMEWGRDRLVDRWWPGADAPNQGVIVVDPARAFGAPIIATAGVRIEDVFDRFSAGESIDELAHDYGLTSAQVEAAIRTEARLLEPLAA